MSGSPMFLAALNFQSNWTSQRLTGSFVQHRRMHQAVKWGCKAENNCKSLFLCDLLVNPKKAFLLLFIIFNKVLQASFLFFFSRKLLIYSLHLDSKLQYIEHAFRNKGALVHHNAYSMVHFPNLCVQTVMMLGTVHCILVFFPLWSSRNSMCLHSTRCLKASITTAHKSAHILIFRCVMQNETSISPMLLRFRKIS